MSEEKDAVQALMTGKTDIVKRVAVEKGWVIVDIGSRLIVVDNEFNQANYPDLIGNVYNNSDEAPSYASMGATSERPCSCGSHKPSWWEKDARGIELARVCEVCKDEKLAHFRPDVLTDPNYEASEPIDAD